MVTMLESNGYGIRKQRSCCQRINVMMLESNADDLPILRESGAWFRVFLELQQHPAHMNRADVALFECPPVVLKYCSNGVGMVLVRYSNGNGVVFELF
jgi:hypothetical protein